MVGTEGRELWHDSDCSDLATRLGLSADHAQLGQGEWGLSCQMCGCHRPGKAVRERVFEDASVTKMFDGNA